MLSILVSRIQICEKEFHNFEERKAGRSISKKNWKAEEETYDDRKLASCRGNRNSCYREKYK